MRKLRNILHRLRLALSRDFFLSLEKDLCHLGFKKISIIFDIGAHQGQTTLHFRKVFRQAQVHCFEPVVENFKLLQTNIARKDRIKANQMAMGSNLGSAFMETGYSDQTNSLSAQSKNNSLGISQKTKVQLGTIDAYMEEKKISHIDLLKIDVEGYEIEVLKGAKKALQFGSIKLILAECDFDPEDTQHTFFTDLWDFLRDKNFSFFGLYDVIHYSEDQKSPRIGYCNALFLNNKVD